MTYIIKRTKDFDRWLVRLNDRRAAEAIFVRLARVRAGTLGVHRSVGGRVSELKISVGKGYRLYYTLQRQTVVFLLCGGDKGTQKSDIKKAQAMVLVLEED